MVSIGGIKNLNDTAMVETLGIVIGHKGSIRSVYDRDQEF